ncbi:DUF4406 domain-containing protein [Holdemanella porci]|uniref:DUF4406 domain-containing protein n=1 Tax=Holdemanella porci TaxID=2652276 RepID=UPI003AB4957B
MSKVKLDYDLCKEIADRYDIGIEKVGKNDAGFVMDFKNGSQIVAPSIDATKVVRSERSRGSLISQIPQKTYYLAHPLTSHGTMKENYRYEKICANALIGEGYSLIRPLEVIPEYFSAEEAFPICLNLLQSCDGIILVGDWRLSEGCRLEYSIAKYLGMEIYELINERWADNLQKVDEYDGLMYSVHVSIAIAKAQGFSGVILPGVGLGEGASYICKYELEKIGCKVFISPTDIVARECISDFIFICWDEFDKLSKGFDEDNPNGLPEINYRVMDSDWMDISLDIGVE